MRIVLAGLNHRTAPVEVRERLAFNEAALGPALQELSGRVGVKEAFILSTCNRVEIAAAVADDTEPALDGFLGRAGGIEPALITPHLYQLEGREAIRHLFRVAASLDSMVVGEPQILGQMRAAFHEAKTRGTLDGLLENVLERAFSVAKRVRTETEIGQKAVSVSYAAVELARGIFGSLEGKRVMLVGAGEMSELAARHLRRAGVERIFIANRTRDRSEAMAELCEGTAIDYSRFPALVAEVDIVIASSGAPHYILTREQVRAALNTRRNRPMFIIDIAVPRNVDPAVDQLDNVFLYDMDDLGRVVEANLEGRAVEAIEAEQIIDEEVERLVARLKAREVGPTIAGLQEQLEQLRRAELERWRSRLGALTPEQQEAVDALTRGIVNKIAHGPITELRKRAGHPEGFHLADMLRRVFRLTG